MAWCCLCVGPPSLPWSSCVSPLGGEVTAMGGGPFSHSKGSSARPAMGIQHRGVCAACDGPQLVVSHLSSFISSGSSPQGGNVTPHMPPFPLADVLCLTFPSSQGWCPWLHAAIAGMNTSLSQIEVNAGGLPDGSLPSFQRWRAKSSYVALPLLVGHGRRRSMSLGSHQDWRGMGVFSRGNGRLLRDQIWYICNNKLYFIEKNNLAAVCRISVKHKTRLDMNEQAKKKVCSSLYQFPINLKAAKKDASWKWDVLISRLLVSV